MNTRKSLAAAAVAATLMLSVSGVASAGTFHFTGNIANHNDVITTSFTLDTDATNVRVWTDSFQSATNFDPITALWNATTGDLIAQNDDNDSVNPATQTWFDSGFSLASLAAGDYLFTVTVFSNFAPGPNIANGFGWDNQAPIAWNDWCQPANGCTQGTYWSVWLDGVDRADPPNPTPEPASLALFGLALAGLALRHKRS